MVYFVYGKLAILQYAFCQHGCIYRDTLDKGAQKRLICPYLCRPT